MDRLAELEHVLSLHVLLCPAAGDRCDALGAVLLERGLRVRLEEALVCRLEAAGDDPDGVPMEVDRP